VAREDGITPQSGQSFRGFTIHPASSDTVYVASELVADVFIQEGEKPPGTRGKGGRVYRTGDGGMSWNVIWKGDALARYIWIAPDDPNRIYVSTGFFDREPMNLPADPTPENMGGLGILRSTDGGTSWTVLGKERGLDHLYVGSLFMKPGDSQTLLAGAGSIMTQPWRTVGGVEVPNGGAYLTTDGGDSWQEVIAGEHITSVEYCQQDPSIAYAASERAVFRSADGGRTWTRHSDDVRQTWGPPGLAPGVPVDMQTDPENCDRVFINNYVGGNFLTVDGGRTWKIASQGYTGADPPRIFVDPADDAHVWTVTRMAPWESRNGGSVWVPKAVPELVAGGEAMGVDPADADHVLVDSFARIFESEDGGSTWIQRRRIEIPPDLTEQQCAGIMHSHFAFAPSDPKTVYVGTVNTSMDPADTTVVRPSGLGIAKSTDGGKSWTTLTSPAIARRGFRVIAVSPDDPGTLYAGGRIFGIGVLKSTDGGESWTSKNQGLPRPAGSIKALAVNPSNAGHILLGGTQGLFVSTDAAATWEQVAAGIEAGAAIDAILFDQADPTVVYVGTAAGVVYSTDGGQSFLPLKQGLDGKTLLAKSLALSADGSVLYAASIGTFRLGTPASPEAPPTGLLPSGPNPFGSGTVIRYALAQEMKVDLRVYDVRGRLVTVLAKGSRSEGGHEVTWDGRSTKGKRVAPGIYFVRLEAGREIFRGKVVKTR
jgi:photosystem II stability/assembly factor-like uncharacterized protein